MIFQKNINYIVAKNVQLVEKLKTHLVDNSSLNLVKSESGDINLNYKGINIHHHQSPKQEALAYCQSVKNKNNNSIIVIIGLGLGYLVKSAFVNIKSKIVVYEPNLDILKFTLTNVDFTDELASERFSIASTKTELTQVLSEIYGYKDDIQFLHIESSLKLYEREIKELQVELPSVMELLNANYITLFQNSIRYLQNGVGNTINFTKYNNIEVLKDKFADKPAVIASPGPSLDKSISALKENRAKYVLFATNTSLEVLKKQGIIPDFVMMIDPYHKTAQRLKEQNLSESILIAQSIVPEMVLDVDAYEKFVFYSKNDLYSRWLSEKADFNIDEYENKGTVSYCALMSALLMGCSPLILTGQDLAFSGDKNYSSELERSDKKFELIDIKGQNGEILKTRKDYATFVHYFENFAAMNSSQIELINSSDGGAQINGFINKRIDDVLKSLPDLDLIIKEQVSKYNSLGQNKIKQHFSQINKELEECINTLEKYMPRLEASLAQSKELKRELKRRNLNRNKVSKLTNSILKDYEKLHVEIFDKYQFMLGSAWKELTEITIAMNQTEETGIEAFVEIAEKSKELFFICHWNFTKVIRAYKSTFEPVYN